MGINEITRKGISLKRILYSPKERNENFKSIVLERLFFELEHNSGLLITVDVDTDELIVNEASQADADMVDIALLCPDFQKIYGYVPLWSWEMINQQGYSDAIQIEFYNKALRQEFILQLKAIASSISLYTVNALSGQ